MKNNILWIFMTIIPLSTIVAQIKGDYIWVAGSQKNYTETGGYDGHKMDFNKDTMTVSYCKLPLGTDGNKASICDDYGNLLFFSNGRAVMDANLSIITNGSDINDGEWVRRYWPDPGDGFPGFQNIMFLPDPKTSSGFYLIHKAPVYKPPAKDSFEIRYSYIEYDALTLTSAVTLKNIKFYDKNNLLGNYLTAIRHQNQRDWWVLQPVLGDSILTFLIDDAGISLSQVQPSHQIFDKRKSSSSGTAKFSPDGTKYALYNYFDQLHIYDFDRETGRLSHHQKINVIPEDDIDRESYNFASVEWSPNSRFIYAASDYWLHQIDTWESDPNKKIVLIDTYNGTKDPFSTLLFLMVQGPDCKIYMCPKSGSFSIHVINHPDEKGKACDFVQNGIKIPNSHGRSLPNFPRFRVDEAQKCNPGITSVFGHQVYYRRPLEVFPNPARNIIHFKDFSLPVATDLYLYDMNGSALIQSRLPADQLPDALDISRLPAGRYNLEIYPVGSTERVFYGTQFIKVE